jgi:hypothetical protein
MSLALRQHNDFRRRGAWSRRYFWSRDEYWAKYAVYLAAVRARGAALNASGRYFYWNKVCLLAAEHCARHYGPVPQLLLKRPIGHSPFSLSSPEVSAWLKVEPPFHRRARLRKAARV